jgi:hypothetical protein
VWRVWRLVRTAGQSHEQLPQRLHEHALVTDNKVCQCHCTGGTLLLMQTTRFVKVPVFLFFCRYPASSFTDPEQDPDLKGYETFCRIQNRNKLFGSELGSEINLKFSH